MAYWSQKVGWTSTSVSGSTHRSAFAFILASETRRTFSLRPRRHALSVTQTRQKRAVSQRTFKWLHRTELYSLSRCHEITFLFHRRSFHSGLLFCVSRIINKDTNHSYIYTSTHQKPQKWARKKIRWWKLDMHLKICVELWIWMRSRVTGHGGVMKISAKITLWR